MPITRRRRANPPEQPDNNHSAEQAEQVAETQSTEQPSRPFTDSRPERDQGEGVEQPPVAHESTSPTPISEAMNSYQPIFTPSPSTPAGTNGDRGERQDHVLPIEGGRRTARGEVFRRPPQPPAPPPASMASASLQPPTHEINLPLGNLLHLAYNPGYTGAHEARSHLLHQLAAESKAGGRARCWNCGSIAIVYDRWNTRSKNLGEVGIAFCEICGVWSVL